MLFWKIWLTAFIFNFVALIIGMIIDPFDDDPYAIFLKTFTIITFGSLTIYGIIKALIAIWCC